MAEQSHDPQEVARIFDTLASCLRQLEKLTPSERKKAFVAAQPQDWSDPPPTTVGGAYDRTHDALARVKVVAQFQDVPYYPNRPEDWLKPYPTTLGEAWQLLNSAADRIRLMSDVE